MKIKLYDAEYYEKGIGGFHKASFPTICAEFDKMPLSRPIPTVLDFGCGAGFYSRFLRSQTITLHGLDASSVIQQHPSRGHYDKTFQIDLGNVCACPAFQYDVLFSVEVVEHVANYRQYFRTAYDWLKPGGTMFLTTATFYPTVFTLAVMYRRRLSLKACWQFVRACLGSELAKTQFLENIWEHTGGHYHGFSVRDLRTVLQQAGFTDVTCKYLHVEPVVPVGYFDHPYHREYRRLVLLVLPLLRKVGIAINFLCRKLDLHGSNVLAVARKPELKA